MMTVDPTDDCTFWYTQEYMPTTGSAPWQTRIGSFKFPSCTTSPTSTPTSTPTLTPTNTPTRTATNTITPSPTSVPVSANAYAYFVAAGPQNISVGSQIVLDLRVNGGTNAISASQNYLTFTNSILQVANATQSGCVVTSTLTSDNTVFDATLQNQVCNGNAPCDFGSVVAPPGVHSLRIRCAE